MVVKLIMRSCCPRSLADQTGPRRSETSGRADLFGAGHQTSEPEHGDRHSLGPPRAQMAQEQHAGLLELAL